MIYDPMWETNYNQYETKVVVLKLKEGMKSPVTNPYYYDDAIKDALYKSYVVSNFPEIETASLLEGDDFLDYNIKAPRELEPIAWAVKNISSDYSSIWKWRTFYPIDPMRTKRSKKIGIRPVLVLKSEIVDELELEKGDLVIISKYTKSTLEKNVNIFSVISKTILLSDEYIGLFSFDYENNELGNEEYKEINERIDYWFESFKEFYDI